MDRDRVCQGANPGSLAPEAARLRKGAQGSPGVCGEDMTFPGYTIILFSVVPDGLCE
jgi:hypothetical protein